MCDYCLCLVANRWPFDDDAFVLDSVVLVASIDGAVDAVPPPMIQHLLKPVDLSSCDSVSG